MIASLTGKISHKSPQHVIIDVNGVGYQVSLSLNSFYTLPDLGESVTLFIHTHVREDQISLFGFALEDEMKIFKQLINISGIGPKLAMSILSGLPVNELVDSILNNNISKINSIPGVGRKTAERLIIELKDKLSKGTKKGEFAHTGSLQHYDDVLSALVNLGYKRVAAEKALAKITMMADTPINIILKDALKELAPS